MKFFAALIAFAGAALGQNAAIGLPTDGQKIEAGSDAVVQIQRPVCGKNAIKYNFGGVFFSNLSTRTP